MTKQIRTFLLTTLAVGIFLFIYGLGTHNFIFFVVGLFIFVPIALSGALFQLPEYADILENLVNDKEPEWKRKFKEDQQRTHSATIGSDNPYNRKRKSSPWHSTNKSTSSNTTNSTNNPPSRLDTQTQNAMDVLGLTKPYTEEELKDAYHEKVKNAHPDTNGTKEQFKKVKHAYDHLRED